MFHKHICTFIDHKHLSVGMYPYIYILSELICEQFAKNKLFRCLISLYTLVTATSHVNNHSIYTQTINLSHRNSVVGVRTEILPIRHTGKKRLHNRTHQLGDTFLERWPQVLQNVAPIFVQNRIQTGADHIIVDTVGSLEIHVEPGWETVTHFIISQHYIMSTIRNSECVKFIRWTLIRTCGHRVEQCRRICNAKIKHAAINVAQIDDESASWHSDWDVCEYVCR